MFDNVDLDYIISFDSRMSRSAKVSSDAVWPLKEIEYPPFSGSKIKVYRRRGGSVLIAV